MPGRTQRANVAEYPGALDPFIQPGSVQCTIDANSGRITGLARWRDAIGYSKTEDCARCIAVACDCSETSADLGPRDEAGTDGKKVGVRIS